MVKRRQGLKRNPEQAREWRERSQARARERARAAASSGVRRSKRAKVRIPPKVRQRVYARSGGVCARPGCKARCAHVHHVLDQQQFPFLALVEDNMVGCCADCNWSHHNASRRFPRSMIPPCTWRLAREVGETALVHLERYYPE